MCLQSLKLLQGIVSSSCILIGCWALLTAEAFLLTDLLVWLRSSQKDNKSSIENESEASIHSLALQTIGPGGARALSACLLLLLNSSLVAQIAKAADLLRPILPPALPRPAAAAAATAAVAAVVFGLPARRLEALNGALTAGMLASFLGLLAAAAPSLPAALAAAPAPSAAAAAAGFLPAAIAAPVLLQLLIFAEVLPRAAARSP